MAATLSIPLYLRVGNGTDVQIGEALVAVDSDGKATLTVSDIADGLRQAADALERAGQEDAPDAPA
ncbi:hypothetical protein ACH4C6_21675 [Streptomyces sp. NPDC017943]|uniref:hypothetical protein n=1 Tax=Streptomyces sp. NPDC017943 TaxID=3365019 RepID=UPI0037A366B0